jgi:hypothetical protein
MFMVYFALISVSDIVLDGRIIGKLKIILEEGIMV